MIKDLVIKQRWDLTWYSKNNFYNSYLLLLLFKIKLKAYEWVFWLSTKSEIWYGIQYLYKRNNNF